MDAPPGALLQLADCSAAAERALRLQEDVVDLLARRLGLCPAQASFAVTSTDGTAAAAVHVLAGPGARWVSVSAVASPALQFGTTRLMAWSPAGSDRPHFVLEQGVLPGGAQLQGVLTLWPRCNLLLRPSYLGRHYDAAPEGLQTYNEIWNAAMQRPGWRHYQVPQAALKPILFASISYTFEASRENQEAFAAAALGVAELWVAQALGGGGGEADEAVGQYDERYVSAVLDDPGNALAARLFGEGATRRLLQLTCGALD